MYAAISGLKSEQTMLDVTANNLANVNTLGYKGSRTTFSDALSQMSRGGAAQNVNGGFGGSNAVQVGLGVKVGSIDNLMGGGATQPTGNPLDVAIQGEGWLRVGQNPTAAPNAANPQANQPAAGSMNYTRAGNFVQDNNGWLITQDGYYVIGQTQPTGTPGAADCYINIPNGASDVSIGGDGAVTFVPPTGYTPPAGLPPVANGRATAGFLSLAKFPNEAGLTRASSNRWTSNAASGAEIVGTPGGNFGTTQGGAIEMSNVDLATEFTNMIVAQRGFQANSRVISTADQMLQDLVNLNR
jgi:flagellar hook protein FlgE